jgi:hypothetical protein
VSRKRYKFVPWQYAACGLRDEEIARSVLGRELHEVIREAKKMAIPIQQSLDLWNLEHYLTQRRKEIDRRYDYRYSRLTDVLGKLLHENRLTVSTSCGAYARTSRG